MSPSDPQSHKRTAGALMDLSLYLPPARRAESSARLAELPDGREFSDSQRRSLVSIVVEYARSLPFALLDETQSAEFGEALCWAASNSDPADGVDVAAIRTAAHSLAYETVRQHTAARLDGADSAVVDSAESLPSRARVESARLLVARALHSMVHFAAPDKLEENAETLRQVVDQEPSIDAEQWGKVAFMAGVYARNFPVLELSRPQLRRLWDAARWAVWYEHWFRTKYVSSRINQLVSLMQRLPTEVAAEIIEETAPELSLILTVAKSHAIVEISDFLEPAGIATPNALVLLADVRKRRAGLVVPTKEPDAGAHRGTPTAPGLVATRVREILAARLSRVEAADAIGKIWTYLDPQHDDANKDRLQRGRQGETRQLGDLITRACQSAEWRMRQRRAAVSEEEIGTMCRLALFACGYIGDRTAGVLRVVSLYGLYLLDSSALGVEGYAQLVETVCQEIPEAHARVIEQAVDEAIRHIEDPRVGDDSDLLQAWVAAAVPWVSIADRVALAQFVAALDRRRIDESVDLLLLRKAVATVDDASDDGLSFLSMPDRAAFDEHYRRARVYEIAELLAKHEADILETLSRSLASPGFSEYRPPVKTVRIGQGRQNRFLDLQRKAMSGNIAEAREARDAFARASAGRKDWERQTLREWRVYATAQVDVFDAIAEWLEAFNSKTASLEEEWNLSVFHAGQREYVKALEFLQPSISAARSSYEHLVFACYLAVQVLLHDATSRDDAERARVFLIDNLRNVLAPDAQLLWIVLANTHAAEKDVMRFSDAIRAHRTLWDSSLTLPPPSLPGYPTDFSQRAVKLQPLMEALKRLKMTRTWRLWLNDVLAHPGQ